MAGSELWPARRYPRCGRAPPRAFAPMAIATESSGADVSHTSHVRHTNGPDHTGPVSRSPPTTGGWRSSSASSFPRSAVAALPASVSFWIVGAMAALVAAAFVVNAYRRRYYGGLLVAPAIAVLFVMNIFPLLWSLGLSFFAYQSNQQSIRFVGLYNYIKVLTNDIAAPDNWNALDQHGHVRGAHGLGADDRRLPAGHALRQAVSAAQVSADPGADADDAVGRRLGRVLHLLLRPDLRHPELRDQQHHRRPVHPDGQQGGRRRRHRLRRCLDVVALRHAAGAGGARLGAEISLRGGRHRPRLGLAAVLEHHLPLYPRAC